jgi:hypothetical protein
MNLVITEKHKNLVRQTWLKLLGREPVIEDTAEGIRIDGTEVFPFVYEDCIYQVGRDDDVYFGGQWSSSAHPSFEEALSWVASMSILADAETYLEESNIDNLQEAK